METKLCNGPCGRELPYEAFRLRTRKIPRPRSRCKDCEAIAAKTRYYAKPQAERKLATRRWEKNNPDKVAAQALRGRIRQLGLSSEQGRIERAVTDYKSCPICDTKDDYSLGTRPAIDHDHKTGAFRGVICMECNLGLGKFKDDPEVLRAALNYLLTAGAVRSQPLSD